MLIGIKLKNKHLILMLESISWGNPHENLKALSRALDSVYRSARVEHTGTFLGFVHVMNG